MNHFIAPYLLSRTHLPQLAIHLAEELGVGARWVVVLSSHLSYLLDNVVEDLDGQRRETRLVSSLTGYPVDFHIRSN